MVVLLWIFTGIWPYLKLLLSLGVWLAPTKYIGVKRRGTILLWIDALAKLSVVDIFTMLLGVAVLLVFIGGPDESITSDGVYYALKAIVIPKAGCYCLLIAQRMSRVSSRFLLEYHERVVAITTCERLEKEGDMSVSQINFSTSSIPEIDEEIMVAPDNSCGPSAEPRGHCLEETFRDNGSSDESIHQESLAQTTRTASSDSSLSILKDYRWGYWGVVFGLIAIVLIFAIGCIFAPAIAFDLSNITGLAVESEKTFEEAASEYGVFVVVSGILVQAKFVLNNKIDYIGLGLLLFAVGISFSLLFMIQAYQFVKRKLHERRKHRENPKDPLYGHDGCGLPFYFRLFKWHHMEIYLISFAIGVWQLGSIASYSMYLYCDLLTRIYDILTFLGIAEASTSQCFRDQASNGGNLTIIILSFLILSISFYFEARSQYKKNIEDCLKYIDDRDVPRFSLAWSSDRSKNTRYSHLTESLSIVNTESFRGFSTPPSSPGLTRISNANSCENVESPSMVAADNSMEEPDNEEEDESSCSNDRSEVTKSCPIATPCSVASSSRRSDRSSVIDANCDVAAPPLVPQPWVETLEGCEGSEDEGDAPPLLPSWSMEEDPPEFSSSDSAGPPTVNLPLRLNFLLDRLPIGPRHSLPPPTPSSRSADHADPTDRALPRPRRVRSTEDILRYIEENPHSFT
jgi:hypothetical protein